MFSRLAHFLIPQESNNFRAKILHSKSISFFSIGFLIFQLVLSSILIVKPQVLGYASQISPEKVIELTNQERIKQGLGALTVNSALSEAARRKAGDMFAFNYWAHVSPSGREPWAFFKEAGYQYVYAGENLARDFSSPETVVNAWMASPSHKENLLNPRYKEIGIAVVDGTLNGVDTTLVVQLFGSQARQQVVAKSQPVPTVVAVKTEITPTLVPVTVVKAEIPNQVHPVLAESKGGLIPIINPFSLTQIMGLMFFALLFGLFTLDAYFIWKQGISRMTGRSLAHAIFLLAMGIALILSERGVII